MKQITIFFTNKTIFRVVVILSGGNIDSKVMAQLLTNKKSENPKKRFFF